MALSLEKRRLLVVAALLLWCVALILFRIYLGFDLLAVGLLWNMFLSAVPLCWSAAFRSASERNRPVLSSVFFVLWLLFLPNAPYLLTDLIHLGPRPSVPFWFLLAMLLSCAGAGTLLGYFSLGEVHGAVEQRFGIVTGWIVAASSLMLCGLGIYVGRFLRWNSWDAFVHPVSLAKAVLQQFIDAGPHPSPVAVTVVFGVGLILGYLALRVGIASPLSQSPQS